MILVAIKYLHIVIPVLAETEYKPCQLGQFITHLVDSSIRSKSSKV
jgi:hypothetical protein